MRRVTVATAELDAVSQHLAAVMGADHPQARLVAANVASAKPETPQPLADPAAGRPVLTVGEADLGTVTPLYAGARGRIFRVDEFFFPAIPRRWSTWSSTARNYARRKRFPLQ